ncbi:TetR/AcrR family transcriptional regulator [Secundilactobacillus odoratitofui]|nr:TetR/AcrR family transcriptional regulator [Secundilactobacillus odoratitofui]
MVQKRNLSAAKIKQTAMQLINENGAEQLSFSRVATNLGVKPQAMYPYFKSKEALKVSLIVDFLDHLTSQISAQLVGVAGQEALMVYGEQLYHHLLAQPEMTRLAFGGIDYQHQSVAYEHFRDLIALLKRLIRPFTQNETDVINYSRLFRAFIFGFVQNELWGLFHGSPVPAKSSFDTALQQVIGLITVS